MAEQRAIDQVWSPCPGCGFRVYYMGQSEAVYQHGLHWHSTCWEMLSTDLEEHQDTIRSMGAEELQTFEWRGKNPPTHCPRCRNPVHLIKPICLGCGLCAHRSGPGWTSCCRIEGCGKK